MPSAGLLKQVSSNPLMVRKDQVLAVGNMIAGAMQITRPFKQDCLLNRCLLLRALQIGCELVRLSATRQALRCLG